MTEVKIMGAENKYYSKILKCIMIFKMLRSQFFFPDGGDTLNFFACFVLANIATSNLSEPQPLWIFFFSTLGLLTE